VRASRALQEEDDVEEFGEATALVAEGAGYPERPVAGLGDAEVQVAGAAVGVGAGVGERADGAGGGGGRFGRAGGQQDRVTPFGELAAHLAADPAIAAGNQRDGAHIVDCLHDM